ncbi:YwqG family protein [Clostridium ganghwense]|uniref:YwqG family protein n=1 Tax=Clostridium ganghwense TaxID=312089 RepID=A0ABT4CUR9_9CLOT|nr:YwqG family protein [Clostridium ganghwense]MCY6372648.1 YwqG family protein [Clostridium ganghwense]
MNNVNIPERFMKTVLKNSDYGNESYREPLKNILRTFVKDRVGCTEKFKNYKKKNSGFTLCAAYILSEDKEFEKECKEGFDYFSEYLLDRFVNEVAIDLKYESGLQKEDIKVFKYYMNAVSDEDPFDKLQRKFKLAYGGRISRKQKAYLYFDDSSHVHNIVQTGFLCAKCENAAIAKMGMRFMQFFTKLAPLKTLSIISKLYRVKDSCKFLKRRFDEFIDDLNSIKVQKTYITGWMLLYGQSHYTCHDEGKAIYENILEKVGEGNIEDDADNYEALEYIDIRKQMAIHRILVERYHKEQSVKVMDEIFMDEYVRFIRVNMINSKDKKTVEKMVAYMKGEFDFEEIEEDVNKKFKPSLENCEIGYICGVGSKEYALRGLKVFTALCDINRMKDFYSEFKYDIKPGLFQRRKPDRDIYDFTERLESVGVSQSVIYEFLCSYTKEELDKPSKQPKDELAQRLYRYAKEGKDVLGNLLSAGDREKIFAIYQTGLLESQLNSLVKMLEDSSVHVVKTALDTIKWRDDEEISPFKEKIHRAEKKFEEMIRNTPVEILKRRLKKYSKEALQLQLSEEAVPRWSTKLGGKPYLPLGEEYPEEGMMLLAQINFEEIPKLQGYPEKGLLQFYIKEETCQHTTRYFSEIIRDESMLQEDLPEISNDDCHAVLKSEYKVTYKKIDDTPSDEDYLLEEEIEDILNEMFKDCDGRYEMTFQYEQERLSNKIGGYPYFPDWGDPRKIDEDLLCPDDTERLERGETILNEYGEVSFENEWVCLLSLYNSELEGVGNIQEDGSIYFFIRKVDLEKGDFSDIKYHRFSY